jgi:hypothetical protein
MWECLLPLSSGSFVLFFCAGLNPSLSLREEHRLRVFESRVLRRIFGPKGQEITETKSDS